MTPTILNMFIKRLVFIFILKMPRSLYVWFLYVLVVDYKVSYSNYLYRLLGEMAILHNSNSSPTIFISNGVHLDGRFIGNISLAYSACFKTTKGRYVYKYFIQAKHEGFIYYIMVSYMKNQSSVLQVLQTRNYIIEHGILQSQAGKLSYFLPTSSTIMSYAGDVRNYHMPSLITVQQYHALTETITKAIHDNTLILVISYENSRLVTKAMPAGVW